MEGNVIFHRKCNDPDHAADNTFQSSRLHAALPARPLQTSGTLQRYRLQAHCSLFSSLPKAESTCDIFRQIMLPYTVQN